MSGLTYLITGANRGIGRGLLGVFAARPQTTVIAAVRNVESAKQVFSTVKLGAGSKIITVKIDSTSATDPTDAVKELKSQGITKVDVLISNAGLLDLVTTALETPADAIRKHLEVNTIAPLILIQAFFPLLEASTNPRFFVISSGIGSIQLLADLKVPFFAYGVSKTAVNYLVRKLHFENERLTAVAFSPGWVQTDMGTGAANSVGMEDAPLSLEDSIKGLVTQFDAVTAEQSGTFLSQEGEVLPW